MFYNKLSLTKKLFFIFESFILLLIVITIFQLQNLYDTNILVKEQEINKVKNLQIILLFLFVVNYLSNIISKYEMAGFKGNKFYANCLLFPGFLIECFNLSEVFQMTISEMAIPLLILSILFFIGVDFSIEVNIYKIYSKNIKKHLFKYEIPDTINLL